MKKNVIKIPELSLVILIGTSGSGKSNFAKQHFKVTEVISSDYCRGLVSDDENNQAATNDAFELLHFIASKRLAAGKLAVIDATNVNVDARKSMIDLARRHHVIPVAIVLNMPTKLCYERNKVRQERQFGEHVILNQHNQLRRSLRGLSKEGFRHVTILNSLEEVNNVEIERQQLWTNKRHEQGPFDIIGDVHGCFDELYDLLLKLGYEVQKSDDKYNIKHQEQRKLIFVGDLVDRGPKTPEVLHLVMDAMDSGIAYCVNGNHDDKLKRKLEGRDVKISHGLAESLEQLGKMPEKIKEKFQSFLNGLLSHYVFDDGRLAVAHAGLKQEYIGRASPKIRAFCMYGETTGEIDEYGLPLRYPWARDYRGETMIVYGHTPVPEPEWINNTINIDTGCVFGGKLTALRYPERILVNVDAAKIYYEPIKPLNHEAQARIKADILDIEDVMGKRIIKTSLHHNVTIREENTIAALEMMSRFAIDARWLIYLPPTMSPTQTSKHKTLLEHPDQAFAYFRKSGIANVICEEKHMGSRVIIVVCRDNEVARKRFQITNDDIGACYTRTGRSFFHNKEIEKTFLETIVEAIDKTNLWDELQTNWLCLDCELMPWSSKAQSLLREQYAPVGVAAEVSLSNGVKMLQQTAKRIDDLDDLIKKFSNRAEMVKDYHKAYQHYCWPIHSLNDYQLAPFHILAHENSLNMDKSHLWHLEIIEKLCKTSSLFKMTEYKCVNIHDELACNEAVRWWLEMTEKGGEGMVVKPIDFTVRNSKGLVQPGVKCRGSEYLRIIYGPEYTAPWNLERLRARSLSGKRSLALREYALGYEALSRFVQQQPLYKVHEAVFGVLALESEPIDPRL